jgi:MerR family transcriptional regulator, Zn(II)-responsive regulator of zntA
MQNGKASHEACVSEAEMKVTEFAKRAAVGPDVVRYYVREGLLAPTRNPANGYKLFGNPHLTRIRFIRQAQTLGFTLSEIRGLLGRMEADDCPCDDMREQLRGKIVENRIKLRQLEERQELMESAYANWDRVGSGHADLRELCRLLEGIGALATPA